MTSSTQIYIGNLRGDVDSEELRREFKKFGTIQNYSYKGKYAFIEFDAPEAATEAINQMDGQRVDRVRITVEAASKSRLHSTSNLEVFLVRPVSNFLLLSFLFRAARFKRRR